MPLPFARQPARRPAERPRRFTLAGNRAGPFYSRNHQSFRHPTRHSGAPPSFRRPTVIPASHPSSRRPTVIPAPHRHSGAPPSFRRPTVIPAPHRHSGAPPSFRRPTVIPAQAGIQKSPRSSTAQAPGNGKTPRFPEHRKALAQGRQRSLSGSPMLPSFRLAPQRPLCVQIARKKR